MGPNFSITVIMCDYSVDLPSIYQHSGTFDRTEPEGRISRIVSIRKGCVHYVTATATNSSVVTYQFRSCASSDMIPNFSVLKTERKRKR